MFQCFQVCTHYSAKHDPAAGNTKLKFLVFLTLPVVLLVHCVAVAATLSTSGRSVKHYVSGEFMQHSTATNSAIYWYESSRYTLLVLFALGTWFVVVNLLTKGMFDDDGCTDPFIRSTIAPIQVNHVYQWLFVAYSSVVLWTQGYTAIRIDRDNPKHRAQRVYLCMCNLCGLSSDPQNEARRGAMHQWKLKSLCSNSATPHGSSRLSTPSVPLWRRVLFYVFHLPVLALASLPAIGFVLSKNVPKGTGLKPGC